MMQQCLAPDSALATGTRFGFQQVLPLQHMRRELSAVRSWVVLLRQPRSPHSLRSVVMLRHRGRCVAALHRVLRGRGSSFTSFISSWFHGPRMDVTLGPRRKIK